MIYVVTGTLRDGKRFRKVTTNKFHAMCINLWRGSVWEVDASTIIDAVKAKRKLIKRVWN